MLDKVVIATSGRHSDCKMCRQVEQVRPTDEDFVWDFPHSVALLGPWQFYHGYCVLIGKTHATELSRLEAAERRAFLDEMCFLSRAIEECFRPHKLNYELIGNKVPHLHWHIFPRSSNDKDVLSPVWIPLERGEHDRAERHRLRAGPTSKAETIGRLRRWLTDHTPTS